MTNKAMDTKSILNEGIVKRAVQAARPSILLLMDIHVPKMAWGPKYLAVVVRSPVLPDVLKYEIVSGGGEWHDDWGNQDEFMTIANWKAEKAQETGRPTSEIVSLHPHDLVEGDFLYPGGVVDGTLAVGCSGITGWGDEGAANIILYLIIAMCRQKLSTLREGESKIGQLTEQDQ